MSNEIPEDPYRIIARERSHDEAKESVATNRMLVQCLILINGGAAVLALAFYGAHDLHAPGKQGLPLVIILYCLGICIAVFAGLYLRRTSQEWSIFWELESYPKMQEREKAIEALGFLTQALLGLTLSPALAQTPTPAPTTTVAPTPEPTPPGPLRDKITQVLPDRHVTFRLLAPKANAVDVILGIKSGDDDRLVGEDVTKFEDRLKQANVQHVYTLLPGGTHSMFVWRAALHSFLQQIFKD